MACVKCSGVALLLSVLSCGMVVRAEDSPLERVDEFIRAEMQRQKIPGVAVAIVSKGNVLLAKGFGESNIEHHVPVTSDTIFQSGSVGKQFTAAAVMLLVDDGRLSLDDSITKYFHNSPESWRPIKVRHLLTHTSGIPNFSSADFDYQRDATEDELETTACGLKLEFEPGSRWRYSNTGYLLLGLLIHKVSGKFYGDLLEERVFEPLGMKTARIISEEDIVPNRAAGYRLVKGKLKNQEWVAPNVNTTADGALYVTVLDLVAWDKGLRAQQLLKPESWQQVYTPVTLNSGEHYPYGFGWYVETTAGAPHYSHGGAWQGFRSNISRYLGEDLTVIVLANLAEADTEKFVEGIVAIVDPTLATAKPETESR